MKQLDNHGQLYEYMTELAAKLSARGASDLAEPVLVASRTAWGIPATEFLGESRNALRAVARDSAVLSETELWELRAVVAQLDETFERHSSGPS